MMKYDGDKQVIEDKQDVPFKWKDCHNITISKKGLQIHIENNIRFQGKLMAWMILI